uniref:Uncharacterized protein n=1 Tax=Avena sativa TaxID=4498 RepID=A0ACD6A259_AVESA
MDPSQMMPRSFPMWPPPPPTSSDAMPPPQLPFLPPPNANLAPNRGWKRKNPNPNSSGYQPPAVGDLQVQNRAKARRWFKPNNSSSSNPNNTNPNRRPFFHKPKAKAPRNTSSFIIRSKRAGGIAPLVSPCPVTPAVLPTPVISPARDEGLLSDVLAQQQWGVDGYGSMKGLIRLRPANAPPGAEEDEDENSSGGSDVEEHVEVERRLDHDLSRFEMVYPQPGGEYVFEEDDEYDRRQDVDMHVARLEEENLTLKERLFLMEQEVVDMRRRLEAIEARFSDGAVGSAENTAVVEARAAAAADDDAVEQALENDTERGNANAADGVDNNMVQEALENGTQRGNANAADGADNNAVEEALKNDNEMRAAAAADDDAVEQALENGTGCGNANAADGVDNNTVEEALDNGTERGNANAAAGADNDTVEENDTEMGDAAADADNTIEDSTEKGDPSSGADNALDKSLDNGNVEPEKSAEDERRQA